MSLVLDSSVALAYCFDEEITPQIFAIFDRVIEEGIVVPSLWRYEVANVLALAERRGRVIYGFPKIAFDRFGKISIVLDEESDEQAWTTTIRLAALYSSPSTTPPIWSLRSAAVCRSQPSTPRWRGPRRRRESRRSFEPLAASSCQNRVMCYRNAQRSY